MQDTAPLSAVAHLRLLNCARGHFWESAVAEDGGPLDAVCPTCGAPADMLPLLDLEAADVSLPPPAPTPLPPPYQDKAGKPVVAGYEVLEDLGRSSAGVLQYRAKQTVLNRFVVLKTVLARDDPSQQAWGTLRGEAAALAKVPHPNIVGIFEAGDRERQLFYNAVELVEGPNLGVLLADKPISVPQGLTLVEVLARAVHFAHEKGVVHRGLRPQSVLLQVLRTDKMPTESPEPPACTVRAVLCIPKITGLGLAKARLVEGDVTDQELQDKFPCYLSPEQAWGRSKEIGPATDVYALGAILYECLTGQPPFKGSSPGTTLEQIQTIDPLPIAGLRKGSVPTDVEAIVNKCLHKQPRRRYSSARELADDLRRAADGRPVEARPIRFLVRWGKWSRRNPTAFVALAVGVLGLIGTLWALSLGNNRAATALKEKGSAESARNTAQSQLSSSKTELGALQEQLNGIDYFRQIAQAQTYQLRGQSAQAQEILDGCRADLRNAEWFLLRQQATGGRPRELGQLRWPIASLAWSKDGQNLAAAAADLNTPGEISAWSLVNSKQAAWLQTPVPRLTPVRQIAFSPDGERLYWVNRTVFAAWNLQAERIDFATHIAGQPSHFSCPSDGRTVLVTNAQGLLWSLDARSGHLFAQMPGVGVINGSAWIVAVNADGSHYALVNPVQPKTVNIIQGAQSSPLNHNGDVTDLVYHEGNQTLVVGCGDGTICLYRLPLGPGGSWGTPLQVVKANLGAVRAMAFTHDGKRLATCGGNDGIVRVWDVDTKTEVYSVSGLGTITALAFSPVDYRLAVGADNKVLILGSEQ